MSSPYAIASGSVTGTTLTITLDSAPPPGGQAYVFIALPSSATVVGVTLGGSAVGILVTNSIYDATNGYKIVQLRSSIVSPSNSDVVVTVSSSVEFGVIAVTCGAQDAPIGSGTFSSASSGFSNTINHIGDNVKAFVGFNQSGGYTVTYGALATKKATVVLAAQTLVAQAMPQIVGGVTTDYQLFISGVNGTARSLWALDGNAPYRGDASTYTYRDVVPNANAQVLRRNAVALQAAGTAPATGQLWPR